MMRRIAVALSLLSGLVLLGTPRSAADTEEIRLALQFRDAELARIIEAVSVAVGRTFIFDSSLAGRVTIDVAGRVTAQESLEILNVALMLKGHTMVAGPHGVWKIVPIGSAPGQTPWIDRPPLDSSQQLATTMIRLRSARSEELAGLLKPFLAESGVAIAYPPSNSLILGGAESRMRRLIGIVREIDRAAEQQLVVLRVKHRSAGWVSELVREAFGVSERRAVWVEVWANDAANSLILRGPPKLLAEVRDFVGEIDRPQLGGGKIHVYHARYVDAEDLAGILDHLLSGATTPVGGTGDARLARSAITELSEPITVSAYPPTNTLLIQASGAAYETLLDVLELLDIPRPQVLVEALIMEVDITNSQELGFTGLVRILDKDGNSYAIGSTSDLGLAPLLAGQGGDDPDPEIGGSDTAERLLLPLLESVASVAQTTFLGGANVTAGSTLIQGLIRASSNLGGTNILSAPHVLTVDNEEAEIRVGAQIPIVTSRVQSAAGVDAEGSLATSQNIERQDIGITLRVTPQISEGDQLRLTIFQEITDVNLALSAVTGKPEEVGVSLSNRTVENTVVVGDGETVVIGGLISDDYEDSESKVPWLGDIPILGWLFKSTTRSVTKQNLLVFLTPHIVRTAADLEQETIRKREEFWERSEEALELSEAEREERAERRAQAEAAGMEFVPEGSRNAVRVRVQAHAKRYPVERMREIEREREETAESERRAAEEAETAPRFEVLAATFRDESAAIESLQQMIDAGYDGTLISGDMDGTVLHEIRLGPYPSIEAAREVAGVIREAFGLAPTVVVETEGE